MRRNAFTLIELLIVVAIIAILAAIAVPNFLEAQTRAKVSRAKSDMRTIAVGLEAYCTDWNYYPIGKTNAGKGVWKFPLSQRLVPLTTPMAYITSIPRDPFPSRKHGRANPLTHDALRTEDTFDYGDAFSAPTPTPEHFFGGRWRLSSAGPDMIQGWGQGGVGTLRIYDPSNGTVSEGDIILVDGGGIRW
ncbi:MAG: Type II secretion system protein G precursor [candidate division BRC1 bacterium ADurb.BinA364]|nr:MAG: Type II secretion system protein G precursor [candidate division BRC1 bacterium ADurb.BinA364]